MKELEEIFNEVNGHGNFQRLLLYLVFGPVFTLLPLVWSAELLLLRSPDHWCYHPMTDKLNATQLSWWKRCYIPDGPTHWNQSCEIYLPDSFKSQNEQLFWSSTTFDNCPWTASKNQSVSSSSIISKTSSKCKKGWQFEDKEFKRTLVTDFLWVCENSSRIPEQYTYSKIGILLGSLGLNHLADNHGRKTMIWISLVTIVISMIAKTFLVQYYTLYTALNVVLYAGNITVYQIPTSILMEVVDEGYRSWAMMYTWLVW